MHMRFLRSLTVPTECTVSKVNMNAEQLFQRFPYSRNLFTLRDTIS